jgi:hypothetical protein
MGKSVVVVVAIVVVVVVANVVSALRMVRQAILLQK